MDQGQFQVKLNMPIGTRLEVTNDVARKLETILNGFSHVNVSLTVGSAQEDEDIDALQAHQAQLAVTVDLSKGFSTNDIIDKFKTLAGREDLEGGQITYVLQDSPLRSALAGAAPIEVEIKGPDMSRLKYLSEALVRKLETDPNFYGVQSTFAVPSKETQVVVDKDRAASSQLSVADIAKTALIAIKGMVATKFKEGADDVDIRVRLRREDRENSESIRQLAMRTPAGFMVRLDDVAKIAPGAGASEIRHLDQQRACTVGAQISGIGTAAATEKVSRMIADLSTMKEYSMELGGESKKMAESFDSLKYTFLLALLLIYMIMAAQFESLEQPLIIMSTVPLSVIGVAFTLFITNLPLSSTAGLGVVILAGIVVNNGIVMIDHINHLLSKGVDVRSSVIQGCVSRLRPVLMTTFVTILGVLPLTLGVGRGDELAQPLAVVTFGGLFISTLLTLLVIPLLYYRLARWKQSRGILVGAPAPAVNA
jgi:HAE1 family hydrophobic/amphiphilic exporter-1